MSDAPVPKRRVNDRNILLVLIGAGLVIAAVEGLQWYTVDAGVNVAGTGFTFADLRSNADGLDAAIAQAFFDWLAVTLLVLGGVTSMLANIPSRAVDGLRVAAFLFGLLGALGTFYAVAQLFDAQHAAGGSAHSVVHNSSFGFWSCLAGFVLVMLGGASGPRRV